jgi:ribose 5-phosphate isomerase A
LARAEGIPLTTLDEHPGVDLTIDGADEVDPDLDVIKGRHGFMLREKIVAAASRQEIIVVDESKLVARLGTRSPVPVEVVRFGWRSTLVALSRTGAHAALRLHDGQPFGTDEGHYIIDCTFEGGIAAPRDVQAALQTIPGVVCTGLFLNMVKMVVVARASGIRILRR